MQRLSLSLRSPLNEHMKYLLPLILLACTACQHPSIEPIFKVTSELVAPAPFLKYGHQAILLADGDVFVSDGTAGEFNHQLYHPSFDLWENLDSSRFSYQISGMAILPGAKVLLAGGYQKDRLTLDNRRIGAGAEIYDLSQKSWTTIQSMNIGRAGFTMTALRDGRIMAAGGFYLQQNGSRFSSLSSSVVEFFDPSTETWELGPSMVFTHTQHEALVLSDGRVLILGGNVNEFTGEIFDPITSEWTAISTPGIGYRRDYRTALIDDDHVLLSGGILEGVEGSVICAVYSISEDDWSVTGSMNVPRSEHTLLPLGNGKVLAIGGSSELNDHPFYPTVEPTATCELFDFATGQWEQVGDLEAARSGHQSVMLNDRRIFTVGGTWAVEVEAEIMTIEE